MLRHHPATVHAQRNGRAQADTAATQHDRVTRRVRPLDHPAHNILRYTATYYTEQKLRANEPTLTTTALVSRNKNQNKVSAKWIRNISALTLKQHETPLFLFLVSFYILVKSCSIFISIEKQSSNSESNEM